MVRWYYRSLFDELEEMRAYMESLNRQIYETSPVALLPGAGLLATRMLPAQQNGFRVDVTDTPAEVVVTAEFETGISKRDITLTLKSPHALEISCALQEVTRKETPGYAFWERRSGCMTQVIPVPGPVSEEGSRATYMGGVLEVHLKKTESATRGTIPVA
nr:Hsp20/alpha crystallin family protein [uncultured Methanoregula sp.]